jgi:multiple sugar transport system substrate-binding protein
VLLNNGSERQNAAWTFLKWFTSSSQGMRWSLATGDLPTRASEASQPTYQAYVHRYKGISTFVQNEQNALKARPALVSYNEISQAMGQAIQAVLLGKKQPKQALDQAAAQVNQILAQGP